MAVSLEGSLLVLLPSFEAKATLPRRDNTLDMCFMLAKEPRVLSPTRGPVPICFPITLHIPRYLVHAGASILWWNSTA